MSETGKDASSGSLSLDRAGLRASGRNVSGYEDEEVLLSVTAPGADLIPPKVTRRNI